MTRDHWPEHARRWALVGPPLRPCAEDVAIVERALAALSHPRVLLLGATAELAALVDFAVDRVHAVVAPLRPRATVGDWRALPFADASFDAIVGDGVLTVVPYGDYPAIAGELARVLVPGGTVVLRLFANPGVRESLDDIAIPSSFHALKWRIAMAIATPDVRVAEILAAFDRRFPDRAALPYDRAVVDGIDVYRGSPAVYSFPTEASAVAALSPSLRVVARSEPSYELGERCPTLVFSSEERPPRRTA